MPCALVADHQIISAHPVSSFRGGLGPSKGLLTFTITTHIGETTP